MIVVDAAVLSFWLSGGVTTTQMFTIHLASAMALLIIVALVYPHARLSALVEAGLCMLAGPLGALVLQVTRLGSAASSADPNNPHRMGALCAKAPLSLPDAIHEMHVQGRRSTLQDAEDESYADLLRHGDLPRHNEVIAAISRNYEPEMYPALLLALSSDSPALKVQAAAVFSKLRRSFGDSANELLATELAVMTPDEALERHDKLLTVARSGFVDTAKAEALIARASEIAAMGLLPQAHSPLSSAANRRAAPQPEAQKPKPRLKRYSCGGLG
jgi:hypothetical protein